MYHSDLYIVKLRLYGYTEDPRGLYTPGPPRRIFLAFLFYLMGEGPHTPLTPAGSFYPPGGPAGGLIGACVKLLATGDLC